MARINPHINFNGNAEEAFHFSPKGRKWSNGQTDLKTIPSKKTMGLQLLRLT